MAKLKRARKAIQGWQKLLLNLAKLIDKVKMVIQLLDFIEESRDLTIHQWNFKDILVHHLQDLGHVWKVASGATLRTPRVWRPNRPPHLRHATAPKAAVQTGP
jgi:hypothetical protein